MHVRPTQASIQLLERLSAHQIPAELYPTKSRPRRLDPAPNGTRVMGPEAQDPVGGAGWDRMGWGGATVWEQTELRKVIWQQAKSWSYANRIEGDVARCVGSARGIWSLQGGEGAV